MRLPFNGTYKKTQVFGNKLILNGVDFYGKWGYLGHNGEDYGLPTGTETVAPHKGRIIEACLDSDGYGWYVRIESEIEGSVLAHHKSLYVKVGDYVNEGDKIGLSDNTGASTGPHLHWGYYRIPRNTKNGYGGYIDPTPYFNPTDDYEPMANKIKEFLVSKGYTYTDTHLDVIKVLYESDIKLKSGDYVLKTECQKNQDAAVKNAVEKAKEQWEKEHESTTTTEPTPPVETTPSDSNVSGLMKFIQALLKVLFKK